MQDNSLTSAEKIGLSSVDRALRLLEELARTADLGATELAARIGTSKTTAFRLARTLQARGYVVQNGDASYRLGPRCMVLATSALSTLDLRRDALPAMEVLHAETEETVQLTVLDGDAVVYLEQLASPKPVRSVGRVGGRAPAHGVSGGLVQLAHLPAPLVDLLLAAPLARWTARTMVDPATLRAELEATRERGYAVNEGGYQEEVGGVAAAILDGEGRPIGAISVCVPLFRLQRLGCAWLGERAQVAATATARRLGHGGDPGREAP